MAKTGGTQVKLPTPSNVSEYAVYLNEKGWKCLMGRDGYEDPVSLLISSFSKVKRKDQ